MAKKVNTKELEVLQQDKLEENVSKVEEFFKKNKKTISTCFCLAVVVVLGIMAYNNFVRQPKIKEAQAQAFQAEKFFQEGSFELALNGDGDMLGFEQIAQEYGSAAGESIYLYGGLCNLQLGNWQAAIDWLKKYSGSDVILAQRAIAAQGDALCGLEKFEEALAQYQKAADYAENAYCAEYLLKAGEVAEKLGSQAKALELYKKVKDLYPSTLQGQVIDKYISRIENAPLN